MTTAFTCNWQPQSIHSNQQHRQHVDLISHPFVQLPTTASVPCSDAILKSPLDMPMIADLDGATTVLSPDLYQATDQKSLYTVQLTDLHMPNDMSPPLSPSVPSSPSVDDGEGKQEPQALIKSTRTAEASRSKKPSSRASSTSKRQNRSTSRSTAGRSAPASARSSLQLPTRQPTYSSLSPSSSHRSGRAVMSRQKRDELISLHRESCRLFQEGGGSWSGIQQEVGRPVMRHSIEINDPIRPQRPHRANTAPAHGLTPSSQEWMSKSSMPLSPAMSPVKSQRYPASALEAASEHASDSERSDADSVLVHPVGRQSETYSEYDRPHKAVPATVIDWTTPSTRKREYEKIDRSSRGIRGLWRRFAPRWCQAGSKRVPFYEVGKHGKPNYEGSVRRFRLDVPDEEPFGEVECQGKSFAGLGGDGQDDSNLYDALDNRHSKTRSSHSDRGTWHYLKPKRRTMSTF
ncbi:conserved hypothetical protein [Paecilomyces variotii No. 5]|uniref:Uncharacterized protein n=1 Tax=Byssochlamys spectabilis (strain No. 5 / NBRC 109023) TaxID=1356009 RepID=V5I5T9_BYSSN|nr:conserved hypothetical protein [Paecilomyces variotii No. 5]